MRFTTRPELSGSFGMVASTHWLASAAGMAVLEQGGNAFDAAVAAGLTLQVVEPHLNGPGGDAPILLWSADRGEPIVVCGQGPSPAAATIPRYRELGLELVPGTGLLAACVPGAFDAWLLVLRDFGTLPLADVMRFPIHYAERGFPMLPRIAETIAGVEGLFRTEWRSSAELWLDGGRAPRAGGMWRNPALAATYRRIVAEAEAAGGDRETQIQAGRDAFLRGFVAEAIAAFCASAEVMDSTGRRHRGLLTGDDLAAFEATFEAPVTLERRGLTVCKCGPWSQGPVMLQTLRLLEGFDLSAMGHLSGEYVHTVVECMKLAFADREAWYGDPAFADVPLGTLLSTAYADERRALVGDEASFELRPGSPDGREPVLAHVSAVEEVAAGFGVGEPTVPREDQPVAGDTCHVDVADRFGNLVSATPSGGWLHSSPAIPGLGLCLGT
ncbi:MAG: gamma-glutamyltranspeptidase / glutathione hydrolase, partial [Gaiellaceae bacterium]|nr:gamma-glutamyltranspeptidase / glutathione hydrolase [Gaiellaceae bacterium]